MYACYTIITIYLICIRGLTHENITVERPTIGGLNLYVLVRTYRFINYPEHSSSIGFIWFSKEKIITTVKAFMVTNCQLTTSENTRSLIKMIGWLNWCRPLKVRIILVQISKNSIISMKGLSHTKTHFL